MVFYHTYLSLYLIFIMTCGEGFFDVYNFGLVVVPVVVHVLTAHISCELSDINFSGNIVKYRLAKVR